MFSANIKVKMTLEITLYYWLFCIKQTKQNKKFLDSEKFQNNWVVKLDIQRPLHEKIIFPYVLYAEPVTITLIKCSVIYSVN